MRLDKGSIPSFLLGKEADVRGPTADFLARRLMLQERPLLEFPERLAKLFLRVHHNRAVPRHRLLKRFSRDQQEPDSVVPGVYRNLVTAIKEYERAVVRLRGRRRVRPSGRFRGTVRGPDALQNFPAPAKTYAKAWRVVSTGKVFLLPG